jgi:hypothetical protein
MNSVLPTEQITWTRRAAPEPAEPRPKAS